MVRRCINRDDDRCPWTLTGGDPTPSTPYTLEHRRLSCVNGSNLFFSSDLDAYIKMSVLSVSPSVVALKSYSAGKEMFWCSGVIFQSLWNIDSLNYEHYVLTCATLLRPPASHSSDRMFETRGFHLDPKEQYCLPIDQKIGVYLCEGKLCEGTVVTHDHHYNIAVLSFKSDDRIPSAVFRPLDVHASPCHFPCLPVKLVPGDVVAAVARYGKYSFSIMAARGRYVADCFDEKTELNCMDLLTTDCKINKSGIGGPLINCEGEVIGLNFHTEDYTPFLPINIFLKWWSHYKVTRSHCRPSLGMKVANLDSYTSDLETLDQVRKIGISQGVIVKKVISGSPAESCDLRPGDVVFKCFDLMVVSPLQLFEIIWDMAGKTGEVSVVRDGSCENLKIEVKDITTEDEFYQWPLAKAYKVWNPGDVLKRLKSGHQSH